MLAEQNLRAWENDGFFILRKFAAPDTCAAMLARAVQLSRNAADGVALDNSFVMPEARQNPLARQPEDRVSKIFRLHRDTVFKEFAARPAVLDIVEQLLGTADLDCFLSQFIFKNRFAMGQPWHQDSYYFIFNHRPQVGIWLAVTAATLENGCLHVLPGSHTEKIHQHVPDRRPDANYGYVEIVDHDMAKAVPVLMEPGDLLVFHSHLMHRSTDNLSGGIRAAMVWHYTPAGTIDLAEQKSGRRSPVYDFVAVRRRQPAASA